MKKIILPAVFSGIIIAAALPETGLSFLIWFAFIPLLAVAGSNPPGKSFFGGLLTGGVAAGVILSFIPSAARATGIAPPWGWFLLLGAAVYYGLFVGVFAGLASFFSGKPANNQPGAGIGFYLLLIPATWTGLDFIHSLLLPGMPWTFIFPGYFIWNWTVLIQAADLTGVYGLSFLILLVNAGFYLTIRKKKLLPAVPGAGTVLICLVYGLITLNRGSEDREDSTLKVAVLQGNIPSEVKWDEKKGELIAERYLSLARLANRFNPELIVWTETAIPWPLAEGDDLVGEVLTVTRKSRAHHLIGNPVPAEEGFFNSVLSVLLDGTVTDRYDKIRLLSLVEEPLKRTAVFPLNPATASYRPGFRGSTLRTPAGDLGITVCNENMNPELSRDAARAGAEILINLTNDAWWPKRFYLANHFVFNIFRAVENRRSAVVASNVGISALIDERGRIINRAPILQPFVLSGEVKKSDRLTFYTRYGDLFAFFSVLIAVIGIGGGLLKENRH